PLGDPGDDRVVADERDRGHPLATAVVVVDAHVGAALRAARVEARERDAPGIVVATRGELLPDDEHAPAAHGDRRIQLGDRAGRVVAHADGRRKAPAPVAADGEEDVLDPRAVLVPDDVAAPPTASDPPHATPEPGSSRAPSAASIARRSARVSAGCAMPGSGSIHGATMRNPVSGFCPIQALPGPSGPGLVFRLRPSTALCPSKVTSKKLPVMLASTFATQGTFFSRLAKPPSLKMSGCHGAAAYAHSLNASGWRTTFAPLARMRSFTSIIQASLEMTMA